MSYLKLCFFAIFVLNRDVFSYKLNDTEYYRMPPIFELDDFGRCMSQENGLYCVAKITLDAKPENDFIRMIRDHSKLVTARFNHTYIERGICISKRCNQFLHSRNKENKEDIKLLLEECLRDSYKDEYDLDIDVSQVYYCNQPNETVEIDSGDVLFGAFIFGLIAINIAGTVYDVWLRHTEGKDEKSSTGNQYLLHFSILGNLEHLVSTDISDPKFRIFQGVYGLRSQLSFLMVMAHTMWLMNAGFMDNPQDTERMYDNPLFYIIFNGMMLVQAYFLLSGCLLIYSLLINSETKKLTLSQFPKIFFYRWFRLTSSLAVILGFTNTWFRHLRSGPLWDLNAAPVIDSCRQYWWTHVLFINNYVGGEKACQIQTWHIAVEMQMFVISLFIFLAFKARGMRIGIVFLFLLGIIWPMRYVWLNNSYAAVMIYPEFYRTFSDLLFMAMHIQMPNNVACYAMGMQLGFFLYYAQKNNYSIPKYKILKVISWASPLIMCLIFMSGSVFYAREEMSSLALRVVYAGLHRVAFGALLVHIVLSMVFRYEELYQRVMEWKYWMVPSRLAYSVYLLHIDIIHYLHATKTQLHHASFFNVMVTHLGIVWLSFFLAVPLYVLVEVPFTNCVKSLMLGKQESVENTPKANGIKKYSKEY